MCHNPSSFVFDTRPSEFLLDELLIQYQDILLIANKHYEQCGNRMRKACAIQKIIWYIPPSVKPYDFEVKVTHLDQITITGTLHKYEDLGSKVVPKRDTYCTTNRFQQHYFKIGRAHV